MCLRPTKPAVNIHQLQLFILNGQMRRTATQVFCSTATFLGKRLASRHLVGGGGEFRKLGTRDFTLLLLKPDVGVLPVICTGDVMQHVMSSNETSCVEPIVVTSCVHTQCSSSNNSRGNKWKSFNFSRRHTLFLCVCVCVFKSGLPWRVPA